MCNIKKCISEIANTTWNHLITAADCEASAPCIAQIFACATTQTSAVGGFIDEKVINHLQYGRDQPVQCLMFNVTELVHRGNAQNITSSMCFCTVPVCALETFRAPVRNAFNLVCSFLEFSQLLKQSSYILEWKVWNLVRTESFVILLSHTVLQRRLVRISLLIQVVNESSFMRSKSQDVLKCWLVVQSQYWLLATRNATIKAYGLKRNAMLF